MWSLKRVREWYLREFPGAAPRTLDKWIVPLIKFINEMPGCATLCSCAGAGPHGRSGPRYHIKDDLPYIYMVCRNPQSMAILLMAHKKSVAHVHYQVPHRMIIPRAFARMANESCITFHFKSYGELKEFERRLHDIVKHLQEVGEIDA